MSDLEDNWEELELASFDDLKSKMESLAVENDRSCKTKIQDNIDSLWVQTFIILLVIFDLIIGLTTIIKNEKTKSELTLIVIIIYCVEIFFRIYAYGLKKYFTSILDIIDFIAVLGSLILYIFVKIFVVYTLLVKILRWIRVIRTTYRAIFSRTKKLQRAIRHLQRSNLKGYRDEKYDLDVAYITDDIMIMSRPSATVINQFNHDALEDIKQFLDEKHNNSYRIYDLCVYDHENINENENENHNNINININDIDNNKDINESTMSLFPVNIESMTDGPLYQYNTFGENINNDYAFRGSTVISLQKLFKFCEESTSFCELKSSNVIIVQSTTGLGRCMFMTACYLIYIYPTASLNDIMKFIHNERISKNNNNNNSNDDDCMLFNKYILPSQARFIGYFSKLISHCYNEKNSKNNEENMDNNDDKNNNTFDYHKYAMDMFNSKIGVVIKCIFINNYFDEIDPYVDWECDIFKWTTNDKCVEYDTFKYGIDGKPGKNSAVIKRFETSKPMVFEHDFGIRIYKKWGNDDKDKRKLIGQIILHSHVISLDENGCIKFNKNEIDFVAKDINNKYFPSDFHIVIKAKILRKKV